MTLFMMSALLGLFFSAVLQSPGGFMLFFVLLIVLCASQIQIINDVKVAELRNELLYP